MYFFPFWFITFYFDILCFHTVMIYIIINDEPDSSCHIATLSLKCVSRWHRRGDVSPGRAQHAEQVNGKGETNSSPGHLSCEKSQLHMQLPKESARFVVMKLMNLFIPCHDFYAKLDPCCSCIKNHSPCGTSVIQLRDTCNPESESHLSHGLCKYVQMINSICNIYDKKHVRKTVLGLLTGNDGLNNIKHSYVKERLNMNQDIT